MLSKSDLHFYIKKTSVFKKTTTTLYANAGLNLKVPVSTAEDDNFVIFYFILFICFLLLFLSFYMIIRLEKFLMKY